MVHSENFAPVKLYANRKLVGGRKDYSPLLFPFWGVSVSRSEPYLEAFFKRHGFDKKYYTLVPSPADADFVFVPINYWRLKQSDPGLLDAFVAESCRFNKPLLVAAYGDPMEDILIERSIILRLGHYRSRLKESDVIMPTYSEDLLESYCGGELRLLQKKEIPSVGFAGWADLPFLKYPKTHLRDWGMRAWSLLSPKYEVFRKGVFWRIEAIKVLEETSGIKTNFIKRSSFSGHRQTMEIDAETLRREFVQNLLSSDYNLDVRGDANQSTRFCEMLSLGRIPLYLDTERVQPLEHLIDYKKICVWVDYREIDRIGEILLDFHRSVSPEEFATRQKRAREVFEKYLRIDRFTKYLMSTLKEKVRSL